MAHVLLGVAGGVGLGLGGGWMSALLFGGDLRVPDGVAVGFGVSFFFVSVNTSLGRHVLAPRGKVKLVFQSTVSGAAIGLPLIPLMAHAEGTTGAAVALAISEAVVCLVQLPASLRALARHSSLV